MFEALSNISSGNLRALAASLKDGALSSGITRQALFHVIGPDVDQVYPFLEGLLKQGFNPGQAGVLVESFVTGRDDSKAVDHLFDLVLSGPEVPGVPTSDTALVFDRLVEKAKTEILMVGYAVYNGKQLFQRLAQRMESEPLTVTFHLDISRGMKDTSLESEIVQRFMQDFLTKQWPGKSAPKVFYDPRALSLDKHRRASLHAKCVIIDATEALITSANFTRAAQIKNIETGILIRHKRLVSRIHSYFIGLQSRQLIPLT